LLSRLCTGQKKDAPVFMSGMIMNFTERLVRASSESLVLSTDNGKTLSGEELFSGCSQDQALQNPL